MLRISAPFLRSTLARWLGALCLIATLVVLSGCGGRASVSGKVVENGKPIPSAELRWASETDPSVFGSAATDRTGTYTVEAGGKKGLPPGRYQVTITWWQTRDGKPLPEGEEGAALKQTPRARRFTATLTQEVTASTSLLDLDVTDKGKVIPTE
jgi:hypothetical protein